MIVEKNQKHKCPACDGTGYELIDYGVMGDEYIICELCDSKGFIKIMTEVEDDYLP